MSNALSRLLAGITLGLFITTAAAVPASAGDATSMRPDNAPHFAMTGDEPVNVLLTGNGPTDTICENPADDPTKK